MDCQQFGPARERQFLKSKQVLCGTGIKCNFTVDRGGLGPSGKLRGWGKQEKERKKDIAEIVKASETSEGAKSHRFVIPGDFQTWFESFW